MYIKYNPSQPRVPRGNPTGGQWTDDTAYGGDGAPYRVTNHGSGHIVITDQYGNQQEINDPPLENVYLFESLVPATRVGRMLKPFAPARRKPFKPIKLPQPLSRRADQRISSRRQEKLALRTLKEKGWINADGYIEGTNGIKLGEHKTNLKWLNRIEKRGRTPQDVIETIKYGERYRVPNKVNPENTATLYRSQRTGKYTIIDDMKNEVLHLSEKGYSLPDGARLLSHKKL